MQLRLVPSSGLLLLCAVLCPPEAAWAQQAADTGQLLDQARQGQPAERYAAIDELGHRAQEATAVVPPLVKLLKDKDVQVRWRAARSLGDFAAMATSAVPALQKMLLQDEPVARLHAAAALGRIGDKSPATVDALMKQVTSDEPRVARVAIAALRTLQPGTQLVVGALAKALESNDKAVTSHAIEALVESGPAAVPLLKDALQKTSTAYVACVVISEIGPDAADTVPELTELLAKTTHSKLRIEALLALAKIGPPAKPAAATVLPLLDYQGDVTLPVAAAFVLGSIGATDAVDQLQAAAAEQDKPFLSMVATWSLARLNQSSEADLKRAVDRLTHGLGSNDPMIRAAAAECLRLLEPPSEMVAPQLLKIANDADPSVRANVQAALASLGPQVVPQAVAALDKPEFRELAIQVLLPAGTRCGRGHRSAGQTALVGSQAGSTRQRAPRAGRHWPGRCRRHREPAAGTRQRQSTRAAYGHASAACNRQRCRGSATSAAGHLGG